MKIRIEGKRVGKKLINCKSINVYDDNERYVGMISFHADYKGAIRATYIQLKGEVDIKTNGIEPIRTEMVHDGSIWYDFVLSKEA